MVHPPGGTKGTMKGRLLQRKKGPARVGSAPLMSTDAAVYDSACFTRSGENGTRRIRTPVASKMALAMAAATGRVEGSPAPDGAISGWLISTTSIVSGVSVMSRMG